MASQINEKEIGVASTTTEINEKEIGAESYTPTTPKAGTTVEVSSVTERSSGEAEQSEVAWKPGFRAQFPLTGFLCLGAVIACSISAVLVLVFSNRKNQTQWSAKVGPNVLLSILNSVASICITLAVGQGIAIAWWRKALQGATIKELHNTWNFSTSLKAVVTKYKYFNTVALAALMTKFAIIDGVLFQRSTSTYVALGSVHDVDYLFFPTQDFPNTGTLRTNANFTEGIGSGFTDWTYQNDMTYFLNSPNGVFSALYGLQGCEGVCQARVQNIGFTYECSSEVGDVDYYSDILAACNSNRTFDNSYNVGGTSFTIMFPSAEKNYSYIQMTTQSYRNYPTLTGNNDTQRCPATVNNHICDIRPAIIEYPIVMQFVNLSTGVAGQRESQTTFYFGDIDSDGTVYQTNISLFDVTTMNQLPGFKFIKYIDFQDTIQNDTDSALAGITQTLIDYYGNSAVVTTSTNLSATGDACVGYNSETVGQYASYVQDNDVEDTRAWSCPFGYDDPVSYIALGLNTLMYNVGDDLAFRAGYDQTDDSTDMNDPNSWGNWTQTIGSSVTGQERKDVIYYQSNFKYMAGALASTFVCILCILPAYWGFWELGRKVTLGPFEIAHAFQAPVLAEVHRGNGYSDDLIKAAGKHRVKYNEFHDETVGRNYRFDAHRG